VWPKVAAADYPMSAFATASGMPASFRITCARRGLRPRKSKTVVEPYVFIGRHPQNTLQLADPSVSNRHAYLQVIEGCPFVVDLASRTRIRIAGQMVSEGWVERGQTLEIGEFDLRISGLAKSAADRPSPTCLSTGPSAFQVAYSYGTEAPNSVPYTLRNRITLIGRDVHCHLRLHDERLSGFHVSIVQAGADAWLIDIPGSSGTRLNGRLVRSAVLQVGDRIHLNGVPLEVQLNRFDSPRPESLVPLEPVSHKLGRFESNADEISPHGADSTGDLRQATLMMVGLFSEMKREQAQMMQRQIELMELMAQAFRESRPGAPLPAAGLSFGKSPSAPSGEASPLQTPRPTTAEDETLLAEAHAWFLSKLDKLGTPSA